MAETCKGRKCGDAYQLTEGGLKFYKAAQCKKLCPPGSTSGLCKACDTAMQSNMAAGTKKFHGTVNAAVPNWSHIYDREAGVMSKWGIEKAAAELKGSAAAVSAIAKQTATVAKATAGPASAPAKLAKVAVQKAVKAVVAVKKASSSEERFMVALARQEEEMLAAEKRAVVEVKKAAVAVQGAERAVVTAVNATKKAAKRKSSSNRGSVGAAGRRSPNVFASTSSSRGSRRATGSRATNTFSSTGTLGYNRAARPVTPESERKRRKKTRKAQFGWNEKVSKAPFRVTRTPSNMGASDMGSFNRAATSGTIGNYEANLGPNKLPGNMGIRAPQPSPASNWGSE